MVSSANQSRRSIVPSSAQPPTMASTSSAMVAAWPRMNLSRSAWLWSISRRRSGGASKTTPSPKMGVMNGYASAWSSTSSGARKNSSLASAPVSSTTSRSARRNWPTSPHSSRTRRMRAMGSTRSSSRWPCSPCPPETWGGSRSPTSTVMVCLLCCRRPTRRVPRAGPRSRGDVSPAASTRPPTRRPPRPGVAGNGRGGRYRNGPTRRAPRRSCRGPSPSPSR